jgi:hypothetical protein
MATLATAWLLTGTAEAATYTTCVLWSVQTTDAGNGEDRTGWTNSPGSMVHAYGARVSFRQGSWTKTVWMSSEDACATWSTSRTGSFDVDVLYKVRDANGNKARLHSGGPQGGNTPGTIFRTSVSGYVPVNGGGNAIVVGGASTRSTTASTLSMMAKHFPGRDSGSTIHVAEVASSTGNSAHHCSSNCNYSTGKGYVRLNPGGMRRKFLVGHEMGHAKAITYQGRLEANYDASLSGTCTPGTYGMRTREYNMVSVREGFAHWSAAWTFNESDENDGTFTWIDNTSYDLEQNNPHTWGGYVTSNCGGAENGVGINLDFLRTLWDWTTPAHVWGVASAEGVQDIYKETVLDTPARDAYWDTFVTRADDIYGGQQMYYLEWYGCWNGMVDLDDCPWAP